MQIIGIQKNSFVDYPANISAVIFTPGCNMNCWYCHNRELINETEGIYSEDKIFQFLEERVGFLDAVVVTGGEATLQSDLKEFIIKVKNLGYLVKLDTNGSNPKVLKELIEEKLVDYVAMDIKAPFERYNIITPFSEIENVKKSVEILKESGVMYEFRTTFAPNLTILDIETLLNELGNITTYSLQQYKRPQFILDDKLPIHKTEDFEKIKKFANDNNLVKNFNIKNLD